MFHRLYGAPIFAPAFAVFTQQKMNQFNLYKAGAKLPVRLGKGFD